jgi:hypothetical protein
MITTLATLKIFLKKKILEGREIRALHFYNKSNNILITDWWDLFKKVPSTNHSLYIGQSTQSFFFFFCLRLGSSLHDYHNTLAALTPIIIFSENLKFSPTNFFFFQRFFFSFFSFAGEARRLWNLQEYSICRNEK